MSRLMVKVLQSDDFFNPADVSNLYAVASTMEFRPFELGKHVPNFNLIQPGIDEVLSKVVGEKLLLDEQNSGRFVIPNHNIHFESFENPNEWCFAVALEKCTFNVYYHLSGAKNALQGHKFNYMNLFEWDYHTNILLEPNQGLFYRPWVFHSFDGGLLYHNRLKSVDTFAVKKKILIMGLPGSGKTTLASKLSKALNASHFNADEVRKMYNDWDFSDEGRWRQAERMRNLTHLSETEYNIVDFVCPRISTRDIVSADFIIWMNTIESGRYEDTNKIFEKPTNANLVVTDFSYDIDNIIRQINERFQST